MEGATAMTDPEDTLPDGADYQRGRVFMTGDANAAVQGAFDAGATEVVVNDSHWIMRNLLIEQLDPRAKVIKGFHKPMCMMQGLDETFGVPVAFVAGDDAVCREARGVLGDDLATFAVKDGIDMFTALCLHPDVTAKGIREGVAGALGNLSAREAYRMDGELTFGFEYNSTTIASTCEYVPGVRKATPRTTEFTTTDMPEAMRIIVAQLLLALQVGQKGIYS